MAKRPTRGMATGIRLLAQSLVAAGLLLAHAPQSAWSQESGSRPTIGALTNRDLARQLQLLEAAIRESNAALQALDSRIVDVRDTVEELTQKVESIELPDPEAKPDESSPEDEPDETVKYRPPKREYVDKPSISFACQEGGVSLIDFDAINAYAAGLKRSGKISVDYDLPDCDFKIKGYIVKDGGNVKDAKLTVIRKPGHPGESAEDIQRARSAFQRMLSSGEKGPDEYVISFSVWPDSYDAFRQARDLAWQAGFDVGWIPMNSGERTELSYGVGIGRVD